MDNLARVRDNLEVVYNDMVKILSSNPDAEPRYSYESDLRAAWYAILAAREAMARTVCARNPRSEYPRGVPQPAPHTGKGASRG